MKHPLTHEMLWNIIEETDPDNCDKYEDFLYARALYDKGFEDAIECIREAGLAPHGALAEAQEDFYNKTIQQEDNQ